MKRINLNFRPFKSGTFILALFCFLVSWSALADGPTRAATQAEKDFNKSVLDVFVKALPPMPEGWDRSDGTEVAGLERVTPGSETSPFSVNFYITWADTKRMQEAKAKLDVELEKLAKGPAENLTSKNVEELDKKMAPHDVRIRIAFDANQFGVGLDEKARAAAPVAGALVYRTEGEFNANSGWREGATYVFLGKTWKLKKYGSTLNMDAAPVKGVPSLAVQTIVVRIEADPERAKQILEKIDWEALKKLIK